MSFETAKTELIKGYLDAGLELLEEGARTVTLKLKDVTVLVPEEEIQGYADFLGTDELFETIPVDCSMCSANYREQLVHNLDPMRPLLSFRYREREICLGPKGTDQTYVTVGPATRKFVDHFRFSEPYLKTWKSRVIRRFALGSRDPKQLGDTFVYRPMTIRVHNIGAATIRAAVSRSSAIIETSLFGLAYGKRMVLRLTDEWTSSSITLKRPFGRETIISGDQLALPKVTYNSDIVRFYQFGMSTDIPILQFLSFYQVLEYFFVATADEQLYARLSSRINDFRFSTTPENLDRLIQEVSDHNTTTDELEMLKNVINKYVSEQDLITFIEAYEDHLEEKLYTKKRDRFGVELEVKLNPNHVVGNVAKVIKTVRNALVHSSDRFDRNIRYVPFSESTKIVELEVPLVKFLAERVIIASAKEYNPSS